MIRKRLGAFLHCRVSRALVKALHVEAQSQTHAHVGLRRFHPLRFAELKPRGIPERSRPLLPRYQARSRAVHASEVLKKLNVGTEIAFQILQHCNKSKTKP